MKNAITFACLGAVALALGGCGNDKAPERQDTAGGEILDRSVGDDMLPYDTVRSQPPLAPSTQSSGTTKPAGDETDGGEGESAGEAQEGAPTADDASPQSAAEVTPAAE